MTNQSAARSGKTTPKNRRIVTLDPSQFALYQSSDIEIHSPDGELLNTIGDYHHRAELEVAQYRLRSELSLVASLLAQTKEFVELDKHAISGMQDLLWRAEEMLR